MTMLAIFGGRICRVLPLKSNQVRKFSKARSSENKKCCAKAKRLEKQIMSFKEKYEADILERDIESLEEELRSLFELSKQGAEGFKEALQSFKDFEKIIESTSENKKIVEVNERLDKAINVLEKEKTKAAFDFSLSKIVFGVFATCSVGVLLFKLK